MSAKKIVDSNGLRVFEYENPFWKGTQFKVTLKERTSVTCAVDKLPTHMLVIIEFIPNKRLLDFDTFREYLKKFPRREMLMEEVALTIFYDLKRVLEPKYLKVTVIGEGFGHGEARVEVST